MRDAPALEIERFWNTQTQSEINPDHRWDCAGPFNVAGRVTSLAIHPADPSFWVAGSAAGGVWVSSDAGASWKQTWSRFATQSIGAVGFIELWEWCIVVATGEANMHADHYPGSGLYYSIDKGLTWSNLLGKPVSSSLEEDIRKQPRRIGSVAFGKALQKRFQMVMGSVYLDDSMPAGLYFVDFYAETSTPCDRWGKRSYNCHSVLIHPDDGRRIYVAVEPDGSENGIWRTSDAGRSWEHLMKGLPPGEHFRRTSLAFAPSDPDVVYALVASRSDHVLGMFRSTNGGQSWKEILDGRRFPKERQMSYNNTLAVHPRKPDSIVWGGMKLYRTDDAGRRWRKITTKDRSARNYVHDDHHALLWPEDDKLISGNDGGVSVSEDGGRSWKDRSQGMVTTMFYDLDVAPSDGAILAGGTQDHGTLVAGVGDGKEGEFIPAIPGDGAWTVFDPADAENVFASANNFDVRRHRRGRPWDYDNWKNVSPKPDQVLEDERSQRAVTVLAIEPSTRKGTKKLFAGTARLWSTDTSGRRWKRASPVFDRSPISAIGVSSVTSRLIFVGTTTGGIFRSGDGGATWSENLAGPDIPSRAITSIQIHPKSAATVVVTVAATGIAGSGVELGTGASLPYGHVFRSKDGGAFWEDIDGGALPNVAYFAAAYETHPPYRLFVAGDVGVWAEIDGRWLHINGNLPSVVVSDLVYHHKDRTLTAATYGRGVWRMTPRKLEIPSGRGVRRLTDDADLRVDPGIAAPVPRAPADRAISERVVELSVEPVPGAAGYQFELSAQFDLPSRRESTRFEVSITPRFKADFTRAGRTVRWRVAAISDGLRSRPSKLRRFTFINDLRPRRGRR
jgi:photosystem II stability/assembly factor-like uncharacterized protein